MRTEASAAAGRSKDDRTGTGRVTIRHASGEADIETRLALGRRLHAESVYASLPYDEDKVRKTLRRALARPDMHCLLMAEIDGVSVGMLYGRIGEHAFSRALGATVHTCYVSPDRRGTTAAIKMLHGFRRWAVDGGAVALYVSVSTGIRMPQADRFFRKLGFKATGGNYLYELQVGSPKSA